MTGPAEFAVDAGTPLAVALGAAWEAFEREDVPAMDRLYGQSVRLASGSPALAAALAAEHVSRLRALDDSTTALARCEEYLDNDGENLQLRLLRAETRLAMGDNSRIAAELDEIDRIAAGGHLRREDEAHLDRLRGLAAALRGDTGQALRHLREVRLVFAELGDEAAASKVDLDIRAVEGRRGDASKAVRGDDDSPQARMVRAEELRMDGWYEKALAELAPALAGKLDPAIRFQFLFAKIRLLRLLHSTQADELLPELYAAAEQSPQPEENRLVAGRLDPSADSFSVVGMGGHLLQAARAYAEAAMRLAEPGQPDEAERRVLAKQRVDEAERLLLTEQAPPETTGWHVAEWHLAAGEIALAIAKLEHDPTTAAQAVHHLEVSAATEDSPVVNRITALRRLGDAHERLRELGGSVDGLAKAAEAWAEAHRLEEHLASRQDDDENRIRMLLANPTEFDKRIEAAARAIERGEKHAAVAAVVAMEAARGSAILPRILPDEQPLVRDLPGLGDLAGARRWIRQAARGLPRKQLIWMLHATPDGVHHAFVWRRGPFGVHVRHASVRGAPGSTKIDLAEAIGELKDCWANGVRLEGRLRKPRNSETCHFDQKLHAVVRRLGIGRLWKLPGHIERIAVVAGGDLAEIPFALLPCPGPSGELLGGKYALSDLPCLSIRRPLRRRARGQRGTLGEQMLLVQPEAVAPEAAGAAADEEEALEAATEVVGRKVLSRAAATPAALREELASGQFRLVRVDGHGEFQPASAPESILFLAPKGESGHLSAREFQEMNLRRTGTLMLGSCESGMAERIGRDERTGFVRAAFLAGASSVVAARWDALDVVAARVLDGFEKNLRRHPRDVALFRALREEHVQHHADGHPARWALWTLYGDVGHQNFWYEPLSRWWGAVRRRSGGRDA
ncbi:CHAT domain-containing protein [Saccharopolyspora spinosa]|uniref:CHAT domain-containing protein n=1 Tax=Saccharopolyspora spinosa TaxID=60894 RepID=A0A2N3Y7F0_SACSN|nr:CHAT domain-containing protein [Saccharopolyspora spinosa]PKW18857.1 CHAT domain-containing protein [Saccharopolyspora spinosa]